MGTKIHLRTTEVEWRHYGICSMWAYPERLTDDPQQVTCKNCLRKIAKEAAHA